MNSTYVYSPLPSVNSIRLLCLRPGVSDEPISGYLIIIGDYVSAPEYHSLSYCWGDVNDTTGLTCNGMLLTVTKSLYAGLHSLRKKVQSQLVWADAICINQDDILERNQQVSIMNQIYLRASRVYIWIGSGDEDSVSALNLARSIGYGCCKKVYEHDPSPASWLIKLREEPDRTEIVRKITFAELEESSCTSWQPFWRLYQSDWFFRIWVIQEVRGCPDIWLICRDKEIEWDFVALAAIWAYKWPDRAPTNHFRKSHFPSYYGFQNTLFMWTRPLCTRREAPFPALLSLTRQFRSTDPRDKVFAMLQHSILQIRVHPQALNTAIKHPSGSSSSTPVTHLNFRADYNMTTSEVYCQVALDSIKYYGNLEVLCYAWQTAHLNPSYASWVPRWDIPVEDNTPLLPFLYDAAKETLPSLTHSPEADTLRVLGLQLGSIVETDPVLRYEDLDLSNREDPTQHSLMVMSRIIVQDRWQDEIGLENAAERVDKNLQIHFADFCAYILPLLETCKQGSYICLCSVWCNVCGQFICDKRKPTAELSKLYNCQICNWGDFDMCSNCFDLGERCPDPRHKLQSMTGTSFWCPYTDKIIKALQGHASMGKAGRFWQAAVSACRSRVFLRTSQGQYGVGPTTVKPGDTLAVLFGSRVPVILRRHGNFYRLICDCYIHGLMDGEAIQMWKSGKLNTENFDIR